MYPPVKPYRSGYLNVGQGHRLYWEESGNPDGAPVVDLHGGPGGGCEPFHRRFFDPKHYRIILFDQRGAGRSKPHACLRDNSIPLLVGDIERLRTSLGIERWFVSGGSWGSALGMYYAIAHPERVIRMMLRGIFFADMAGALDLVERDRPEQNEYWSQFADWPPVQAARKEKGLFGAYHDILADGPHDLAQEAGIRFYLWDVSIATWRLNEKLLAHARAEPHVALALSRIFFSFAAREYRDGNRDFLLQGMARLRDIPVDIVHGENDLICHVREAYALKEACPWARLHALPRTGHARIEPAMKKTIVEITDRWRGE